MNEYNVFSKYSFSGFTIERFLLSALVDYPEVNSKGEVKVEQVKKYASLLVKAKLADEKILSKLTEELLEILGIPLDHAVAISEAGNYKELYHIIFPLIISEIIPFNPINSF